MKRWIILLYGLVAYAIFFVTFLYAIGFVANWLVPRSIDGGPAGPRPQALLVDALLLAAFAVQHSVMARQWFKDWWTRIVPPAAERSTYVLIASLLLALLFWLWRPMPQAVWDVPNATGRLVLWGFCALGWAIVLASTFMIGHFDLFGLRQVYLHLSGRQVTPVGFKTPALYRYVRHPIMLGFIIAFWATPQMSAGHLFFAGVTTGYILVAIQLEERALVGAFGDQYRAYQRTTSMLLPLPKRR